MIFREKRPDDFITFSCGHNFTPIRNKNAENIINKFFEDFCMTDKEDKQGFDLKEYILNIISFCMVGIRKLQELYFLNGSGNNGKSALLKFLKFVFGDYFIKLDSETL